MRWLHLLGLQRPISHFPAGRLSVATDWAACPRTTECVVNARLRSMLSPPSICGCAPSLSMTLSAEMYLKRIVKYVRRARSEPANSVSHIPNATTAGGMPALRHTKKQTGGNQMRRTASLFTCLRAHVWQRRGGARASRWCSRISESKNMRHSAFGSCAASL